MNLGKAPGLVKIPVDCFQERCYELVRIVSETIESKV